MKSDLKPQKMPQEDTTSFASSTTENLEYEILKTKYDTLQAELASYKKNLELFEESIRHSFKEREDRLTSRLKRAENLLREIQPVLDNNWFIDDGEDSWNNEPIIDCSDKIRNYFAKVEK